MGCQPKRLRHHRNKTIKYSFWKMAYFTYYFETHSYYGIIQSLGDILVNILRVYPFTCLRTLRVFPIPQDLITKLAVCVQTSVVVLSFSQSVWAIFLLISKISRCILVALQRLGFPANRGGFYLHLLSVILRGTGTSWS